MEVITPPRSLLLIMQGKYIKHTILFKLKSFISRLNINFKLFKMITNDRLQIKLNVNKTVFDKISEVVKITVRVSQS